LASEIASNPITANALTDTQESELYLVPFLKNHQHAFTNTLLTVVDYRGRQIASNAQHKISYQSHSTFTRMMQLGQTQISLLNHEKQTSALLVALPVQYQLSGHIEGGVMLEIPIESMLQMFSQDNFD